jgi:RNA polymerase sigma-70 factor (ECF subfamily)
MPTLSHSFAARLPSAQATRVEPSRFEPILRAMVEHACAAHPAIDLDPQVFIAYVAEHLPVDGAIKRDLERLHVDDLYLACACSRGDPLALQRFEQRFLSMVSNYVGQADASPSFTDEVRQELRDRLLAPREGRPPKITAYTGRGPLGAWVRVAAARTAIDLRRAERPHAELDGSALRSLAADPELRYLKERYGREFRRAFAKTLASLSTRAANVLRLHYLEGMNTVTIGATYGVHSRTIHKWLTASRQNILIETRKLLGEQLGLKEAELDSLMVLVQSELDVSIVRFLQKRGHRSERGRAK